MTRAGDRATDVEPPAAHARCMETNRARIREGTPVLDTLGREIGEVSRVLVGATTRGPRFFTLRGGSFHRSEHLVPCEAVDGADRQGRLRLSLARDQVNMLPAYEGRPPTEEEARHAFTLIGGLRDDPVSGESAHMVPFEDTAGPQNARGAPTMRFQVEEILILPADERAREGYADEWVVGGGPGP